MTPIGDSNSETRPISPGRRILIRVALHGILAINGIIAAVIAWYFGVVVGFVSPFGWEQYIACETRSGRWDGNVCQCRRLGRTWQDGYCVGTYVSQDGLPDMILSFARAAHETPRLIADIMGGDGADYLPFGQVRQSIAPAGREFLAHVSSVSYRCKLETESPVHPCGVVTGQPAAETGNNLYVTTPLQGVDGQILVLASSTSPERSWILSLAPYRRAEVLYASFRSDRACVSDDLAYPLRVVDGVQYEGGAAFTLHERGNAPEGEGRRLIQLSLGDDGCHLRTISGTAPSTRG